MKSKKPNIIGAPFIITYIPTINILNKKLQIKDNYNPKIILCLHNSNELKSNQRIFRKKLTVLKISDNGSEFKNYKTITSRHLYNKKQRPRTSFTQRKITFV